MSARRISIFGATGSVGQNTVELLMSLGGAEHYAVEVLTGHNNAELLARQARALGAARVVIGDARLERKMSGLLSGTNTRVSSGPEALLEAAQIPVDWAMSSIVGAAGLAPTVELAKQGCILALANKESIVCAGAYLLDLCAAHGTILLPVDSEHSAIFQALGHAAPKEVSRILLTASGGPFRTWSAGSIAEAKLEDALKHPNWSMGQRITIDSASMFNKALEIVEAHHLFGLRPDQIEVVVHPQSIIHSMVEFADGAIIAQMGAPDMRGPIGYALHYPKRQNLPVDRLDFTTLGSLDFEAPDVERFPALSIAGDVMEMGGAAGAVMNAAKEAALDLFVARRITFGQMAQLVRGALDDLGEAAAAVTPQSGLEPVFEIDSRARDHVLAKFDGQKASVGA